MRTYTKRKTSSNLSIFLKTICAFLPTIWIPVVINWIGQYIGFVSIDKNSNKEITVWGWIVTGIVFFIIFRWLYINNRNSDINTLKEDNEVLEQNNKLLDDIISRMILISSKKYERYLNNIEIKKGIISKENLVDFLNPKEEIKVILENISFTFFLLTREFFMKQQDIVVTLAYYLNGTWHWIENSDAQDGLSLEDLVKIPNTTLYNVINGKSSFIFHPCKIYASSRNEYQYDAKDEENLNIGSIVCKKIHCGNNINAVLSISTYGHKMVNESADINKVRDTIKNILVPFEKKIIEEFIVLYIKNQIDNPVSNPENNKITE